MRLLRFPDIKKGPLLCVRREREGKKILLFGCLMVHRWVVFTVSVYFFKKRKGSTMFLNFLQKELMTTAALFVSTAISELLNIVSHKILRPPCQHLLFRYPTKKGRGAYAQQGGKKSPFLQHGLNTLFDWLRQAMLTASQW